MDREKIEQIRELGPPAGVSQVAWTWLCNAARDYSRMKAGGAAKVNEIIARYDAGKATEDEQCYVRDLALASLVKDVRIAELEADNERLIQAGLNLVDGLDKAEAALREAQKDAERYRFLRNFISPEDYYAKFPRWTVACESGGTGVVYNRETMDAAIDAAMAKGE